MTRGDVLGYHLAPDINTRSHPEHNILIANTPSLWWLHYISITRH